MEYVYVTDNESDFEVFASAENAIQYLIDSSDAMKVNFEKYNNKTFEEACDYLRDSWFISLDNGHGIVSIKKKRVHS